MQDLLKVICDKSPKEDYNNFVNGCALRGRHDLAKVASEVEGYTLSPAIEVSWLPDGDHSLVPRKSSGRTASENLDQALGAALQFIKRIEAAGP